MTTQHYAYIVQIEDCSKTYGNATAVQALDRVSFFVVSGAFLVIVGLSGSGKPTLLNLIGTLDQPTSGRVVFDEVDANVLRGDAFAGFLRATIGFVFQLNNLVPTLTATDNTILPLLPYRRGISFNL
jgi:ABC-type lipoprotein export system ATPase subunit